MNKPFRFGLILLTAAVIGNTIPNAIMYYDTKRLLENAESIDIRVSTNLAERLEKRSENPITMALTYGRILAAHNYLQGKGKSGTNQ